ncbi:MAG: uracil phosphoribosyltransferase [Pedosphaera sp.]|nr:uracil phosphoribosyltransferase [Pedosphaera sp.]MSU43128.1 uracil phosphoribosyltransferase [Pedosphaera sp.]
MKALTIIGHPLVQAKLTRLRDRRTSHAEFRRLLGELAAPLVYEATRDLPVHPVRLRTPVAAATGVELRREVLLTPILRAGLGMLDALRPLLPEARVGFIGLARNESTLLPEWYLDKVPARLDEFEVLVLDPMLATGGSAIAAGELLQSRGARNLCFVHIIASAAGARALARRFPKARIVVAAVDARLDKRGYIVPGLGDAGDRACGC